MKVIGGIFVALLIVTCSQAQTYDATTDFSRFTNPNGVWSYGYSRTASVEEYKAYDRPSDSGLGWMRSDYRTLGAPSIWRNTTGGVIDRVLPGQLSLHAGLDVGSMAILRFEAPVSGSFSFFIQFFAGDLAETAAAVYADGPKGVYLIEAFDTTSTSPYVAGSVNLSSSQFMYITVRNSGQFTFGNTPVDVLIVQDTLLPVPEPSVGVMLMVGLALLIAWKLINRQRLSAI